jgi:hypothetical protein
MRARLAASAVLVMALLAAACGSSSSTPKPVVSGSVGFDQNTATTSNGTIPQADPFFACGSSDKTFGTELLQTRPDLAKVANEWGDVVPGKEMLATGTVTNVQLFAGDLPFTHPFGTDLNINIKLDPPYSKLAQILGTESSGLPAGDLHMELSQGLVPHQDPTNILTGFLPVQGDRFAAMGHWIIDCGHGDFHTELHPMTFLAYAHTEGAKTVAHVFYDPYVDTQVFTPLADKVVDFSDPSRVTEPGSQRFPLYLFQELLRIGHLGPKGALCCADRITSNEIIDANTDPVPSFYVCPPGAAGGGSATFQSSFVTRPGVTVTGEADSDTGCVRFDATIGSDYKPLTPARKDCVTPWDELNSLAGQALGDPTIDLRKGIGAQVPASFLPAVNRDPEQSCYDPMVAPAPAAPADGLHAKADPGQAFPFYGEITVSK